MESFLSYLQDCNDYTHKSKIPLLFIKNRLSKNDLTEEECYTVFAQLKSLIPGDSWSFYCIQYFSIKDFQNRLLDTVTKIYNGNTLYFLEKQAELSKTAFDEQNLKSNLFAILVNYVSENPQDEETLSNLELLFDLIDTGQIKSIEDLQNYGIFI